MALTKVFMKVHPDSFYAFCLLPVLFFLSLSATPCYGRDVSFTWTANPEQVDGYRLYYKTGSSGAPYTGTDATEGPSPVATGNVTTFTLHGLSDTETYYFTITAYLGTVESGYAEEVVLNPVPVNYPPTASDVTLSTHEDVPLAGALPANDAEGDPLTYTLVTSPTRGTAAITNTILGSFTYTPHLNLNGSDSFTFKVNDGSADSNIATVNIGITAVNDVPTAINASVSLNEDSSVNGLLPANDQDGDPLTFSIVTNGSKGSAVITSPATGAFTYTPNKDATGSDSFTFKVNDGTVDSNTATVTVTINSVNDPPTAAGFSITVDENQSASGQLTASDPDGDPMTFSIVANGSKGSAVITNPDTGAFSYTPNKDATGSDSFTFKVNDGMVDSNKATVTVTIKAVNDPPTATGSSVSTYENQPVSGQLTAIDPDGDPLTYSIVTNGSKGSAVLTNLTTGAFTYTPNKDETGSDSFTFKVNDGTVDSNTATVAVSISIINEPPTAAGSAISTDKNQAVSGQLTASDPDGDPLTFSIVANGSKGSAVITNQVTGAFTYTPNKDETGSDSFTFKANDGTVDSNIAQVSVTINAVNDPPTASGTSVTTEENQTVSGQLTASDADGDSLTFSIVTNGSKGVVVITNQATGAFTYTPNKDATGSDSFTFKVNDGMVDSNKATVTVTIKAVNDPPTATGSSVSTYENQPVSGQLTAIDPDGDPLTYSIVTNGSKGSAVITNPATGAFTYTPNKDATGSDAFTFKVNDGTADSNTATVTVSIAIVNEPPTATGSAISTDKNQAVSGQLTASDPDGDPLTFSIIANGSKGSAVLTNPATGAFTYTPNKDATGNDSFTFKVNDGTADSNTATVTVSIAIVNEPPTATGSAVSTDKNQSVSGQLIASDPDGDPLTYSIVANGSKGSAVITNPATGAFTYTPNNDQTGSDTFTFKVNDGTVDSNIATVTVTITVINTAPVASNDSFATEINVPYSGNLLASDPDGDPLTFTIFTNARKGSTAITNAATGAFTYTPKKNKTGSDSFTFKVNDGTTYSNVATVAVTINETNEAPTAAGITVSTDMNTPVSGELPAGDPDGDVLTYSIVINGSKGSAQIIDPATGAFTYTPEENKGGSDFFTFKVNDGTVDSNTATVTVTIFEAGTVTKVLGDIPDADYPGTLADTYTNLNPEIYAHAEKLQTYSWSPESPHKPANTIIMKANLTKIPTYATVLEAKLTLYQMEAYGEGEYTTSIHRIIGKNPVIAQVTGFNALSGEAWTPVPEGATFNNIPLGLADIDSQEDATILFSQEGYRSWLITNMVQQWVKDPTTNFGLLLRGVPAEEETARIFASAENQNEAIRPALVVRYKLTQPAPVLKLIREIK